VEPALQPLPIVSHSKIYSFVAVFSETKHL
jgi:hypothetical protein